MKPVRISIDVDAVDTDGIADGNSSAITQILLDGAGLTTGHDLDGIGAINSSAATTYTMDGVLTGGGKWSDSTPRHIIIEDIGDDDQSTATYTITGIAADSNKDATEDVVGPSTGLFVLSVKRWTHISSITIAAPVAGSTASVGPMGIYQAVDSLGHKLNIIGSAHVQTGSTYTVTGMDVNNKNLSEDLTGPGSGATVETTKYFKEVWNVVTSAGVASSTVDIGTVDEVESNTVGLDHYLPYPPTVQTTVTGTLNFDIEVTNSPLTGTITWANDVNFTSVATSTNTYLGLAGHTACRVVFNSYSTGAELLVDMTFPY